MMSDPLFSKLLLVVLLWLCVTRHLVWPSEPPAARATPPQPTPPLRKHPKEPTPFAGHTRTPHCDACEQAIDSRPQAPSAPPPPIVATRGRPRQIDTSYHVCPNPACAYYGWVGLGNIRAHGHPGGSPWRQLYCSQCEGYILETYGTIFHSKRVPVDLIIRVIACLAEGLGIRGTARVFELDPHTVLRWLVEAAEQLQALSQYVLYDLEAIRKPCRPVAVISSSILAVMKLRVIIRREPIQHKMNITDLNHSSTRSYPSLLVLTLSRFHRI